MHVAKDILMNPDNSFGQNAADFIHADDEENGGLATDLYLCVGFPVMLRLNEDVSQGLANGAIGHITHFDLDEGVLAVKFKDRSVGKRFRSGSHRANPDGSIKFYPTPQIFKGKGGMEITRFQFPFVNCWACTIHKAQGRSEAEICVNLGPGMSKPALAYAYGFSTTRYI